MRLRAFLHVFLDLVIGLGAAFLLLSIASAVHTIHSLMAAAFLATGVIFCAAFLRLLARPDRPWGSGVTLGIGCSIPALVAGVLLFSAGAKPILWLVMAGFVLIAISGAVAGAATRRREFLRAGIAVVTGCCCALGLARAGEHTLRAYSTPVSQNKVAPEFVLTDLSGRAISGESLKGHIVVLDFWATWCAPCVAEMPSVGRVRQSFQNNPRLIFYAVNPGWNESGEDRVRGFFSQHRFDVPLVFDEDGKAIHSFGATSLPFLVVLDSRGNIRMTAFGFNTTTQLERDLTNKLNELLAAR